MMYEIIIETFKQTQITLQIAQQLKEYNQMKNNVNTHKQNLIQLFPYLNQDRPLFALETVDYIQSFTLPITDIESFTNLYNITFDDIQEVCECKDKHKQMLEKLLILILFQQL